MAELRARRFEIVRRMLDDMLRFVAVQSLFTRGSRDFHLIPPRELWDVTAVASSGWFAMYGDSSLWEADARRRGISDAGYAGAMHRRPEYQAFHALHQANMQNTTMGAYIEYRIKGRLGY